MPPIYVLSHTHSLFPLAHRLRGEGHEVRVGVWLQEYESGWVGCEKLPRDAKGKVRPDALGTLVKEAEDGMPVVTDVRSVLTVLGNAPKVYATPPPLETSDTIADPIALVGWQGGDGFTPMFLSLQDRGLWIGGFGPTQAGSECLMQVRETERLTPMVEEAKALIPKGFLGLVRVVPTLSAAAAETGRIARLELGWIPLTYHAFLNVMNGVGAMIHDNPVAIPEAAVSLVAWVAQTPWPYRPPGVKPKRGIPLKHVPDGKVFWHDAYPDTKEQVMCTGGTDGLIGVARGSGTHLSTARARLAQVLSPFRAVPGIQYRADAGSLATEILPTLEASGLVG